MTTSIDPQWDPNELWISTWKDCFRMLTCSCRTVKELCALTDSTDLKSGLKKISAYANTVVVKNGSEGAYLWDGKRSDSSNTFPQQRSCRQYRCRRQFRFWIYTSVPSAESITSLPGVWCLDRCHQHDIAPAGQTHLKILVWLEP